MDTASVLKIALAHQSVKQIDEYPTLPIDPEQLWSIPGPVVRQINFFVHKKFDPVSMSSRVNWRYIMSLVAGKVGDKALQWNQGVFLRLKRTYEAGGKYVVESAPASQYAPGGQPKHYVVFRVVPLPPKPETNQ